MTELRDDALQIEQQISEHVIVLMRRVGYVQRQLSAAVGIAQPTLSRRLSGQQAWHFWEVQVVADFFGVTLAEMTSGLPTRNEWEARDVPALRACRDSNPKPSDLYSECSCTGLCVCSWRPSAVVDLFTRERVA